MMTGRELALVLLVALAVTVLVPRRRPEGMTTCDKLACTRSIASFVKDNFARGGAISLESAPCYACGMAFQKTDRTGYIAAKLTRAGGGAVLVARPVTSKNPVTRTCANYGDCVNVWNEILNTINAQVTAERNAQMQRDEAARLERIRVMATAVGGQKIPRVEKPTIPANMRERGSTLELAERIEAYMITKINNHTQFGYNEKNDYATLLDDAGRLSYQTRLPRNTEEKLKLGFYQFQIRALVDKLKAMYPTDSRVVRLAGNWKNLVCITTTGNQGTMMTRPNGQSVMTLNIYQRVAKNLNVIAHEMAHCALSPAREGEESMMCGIHEGLHTATWKLFMEVGIDMGWEFVEVAYPNICNSFGMCDPMIDIRNARGVVYSDPGVNGSPVKLYGATFNSECKNMGKKYAT